MNSSRNILDIPDEILIEIILNLNVTERVPLGDTSKKFRALVFEDKKILRDLDFSNEVLCSSASQDIRRYFINEISRRHILKLNLLNFGVIGSSDLPNYFHRAINLVDLNTHGLRFTNIMQLEHFICPFQNLKRLSCDWPAMITVGGHISENLEELLSRLTYWSVRLSHFQDFTAFHNALSFCQELKELRVTLIFSPYPNYFSNDDTIPRRRLKSIERIEYYGRKVEELEQYYVSLIPCPKEWTHFFLSDPITCETGFYLERNVEVCEELMEKKSLICKYPNFASKLGRFVVTACLLKEVMKINGEHLQDVFCCFSSPLNHAEKWWGFRSTVFNMSKRWTLKPEEAKRLLKDPKYPISYLNIFHDIEEKCDAHVVTSAFSSLTELVLSDVTKNQQTRNSDELNQLPNRDSSFSKLVRSTPHVKHLTVIADKRRYKNDELWDLDSLNLIPSWQSLTSLRLRYIPIIDGNFLIEIGKQCKQLDTIELVHLGRCGTCCYMEGLLRMLIYCTNLRYFTLRDNYINRVTDLLFSLAHNSQLKSVCIRSGNINQTYGDLKLPVERLLRCCSQLTKFLCLVEMWSRDGTENEGCRELRSALERLKSELNRPYCQFQLNLFNDYVREDESTVPHCIRVDLP